MSEHLRGGYYGSSPPELRLVLLGNIGCGKTSSADTILGQLSPISPISSRSCQLRQGLSEGRSVTVVEAPRWYWNGGKMEDSVRTETEKGMALVSPGPHAILLLVPVSQFTEMECRVPAELEEVFGEEVLDHTLVLLTCGDYLMGKTPEEYLQKEHPGLRQIIERCGGRYHVINNRQRQDREQVRELLEKVEKMVARNGVYYVKTAQDRDLERRVQERKRELMETYRAQKEERRETHVSNTEARRSTNRGEEYSYSLEKRRREEREEMEGGVSLSQRSNGLHSAPERPSYSEPREDTQVTRTPSFRLNADGAVLSQMSEVKSSPKVVSTFHHRMNSFEDRSPGASPTSPHSPVFISSPSSPTFTSSTTSYPASSSLTSFSASSSSTSYPASSSPTSYPASSSSTSYPASSSSTSYPASSSSTSYPASSSPTSYPASSSSTSYPASSSSTSYPASSSSTSYLASSSSTSYPASSSPTSYLASSSSTSYPASSSSTSYPASSSSTSYLASSSSTSYPASSSSTSYPASSSSTSYSSSSSSSSSPELRLVLLGRSGSGKSSAGNSILGREEFTSRPDSLVAITQKCEKKKAMVDGRQVALVDTPDWFNSEQTPDEVRAQISSCVALSSPGPHAFLFCVPLDQPAKTELQALGALETVFGPEAVQTHTLLLFTYADKLRESGKAGNDSVEAYIAGQRGDLLKLVEKCGDRFHVMETTGGWRGSKNVAELLEKVEQTVKEAGGQFYSHPAFQEAENRVRQRQVEIAKQRRGEKLEQDRFRDVRQLSSERQVLHSYMQPVAEAEEEVREEEIEETRDEAEMSVSTMNIESLPQITRSTMSPSLLRSVMEKMQACAKQVPQLLADGSVWVGDGAKKVKASPMWGTVGSRAQNVQKMVADSAVWGKVGASAGHVSKLVGDRVPKSVVDGSVWVGSGAKAAAASPVWGKVGSGAKSGAKMVASGSMRVGAGIGTGAKNLAQSPMWGKVGSGAKSGAKLMAENSVRLGAGIGAGAKKVAQSPVWGKVGSGAKAGAKMVAESSVWEKIGTTAKQVPMVVIGGALLGLVLGVVFGGLLGGAIGAATGSVATEVGRRKLGNKTALENTEDAARNVQRSMNDGIDSLVKQGEKVLKTE